MELAPSGDLINPKTGRIELFCYVASDNGDSDNDDNWYNFYNIYSHLLF